MTQSEFFKIKTSSRVIMFPELVKFRKVSPSPVNDFLVDFCKRMHPRADVLKGNTTIRVFSNTEYQYELYSNRILRTKQSTHFASGNEYRVYDLPENLQQ
jgi:hypothetical protein